MVALPGEAEDSGCLGEGLICSVQLDPPDPQSALAQKYSPVLSLPAEAGMCAGSPPLMPISVDAVLNNSEVALRQPGSRDFKMGPTATDLFHAGPNAYLDFPGNPTSVDCRYERDATRFQGDTPPVAYAHLVRQPGSEELALQYWFFYYFNDWTARHEGDWEMIQIIFDVSDARTALQTAPVRVDYAQHNGGESAPWNGPKLVRIGDHPLVFVAAGSHSSHFQPGVYIGRGEKRSGFGCDETSGAGQRLWPEVVLLPHQVANADASDAWLAFPGSWGQLPGGEFDAPTGPIRKWQWWGPVDWERHSVRQGSIRAPSPETFGSDAASAFCGAVRFASRSVLPHLVSRPLTSMLFLGLASVGVAGSLARTRYLPARGLPLCSRRRLGQNMGAALDIYRTRPLLFLGTGLLSVPATMFLPALHWHLVARVPDLLPIHLPGVVFAQAIALSLALSGAQLGLTFAVVAWVSVAGVAAADGGGSSAGVLLRVWRSLTDLVVPRLTAAGAVGALALTIAGTPLALRQAVRWAFIEQAVLIDGKTGWAAMKASSRAVEGGWLWAACVVLLLGTTAMLAPYLLATGLMLLFRSAPLTWMSLASSVIYACLIPYLAIAMSLAYLDLRARQ